MVIRLRGFPPPVWVQSACRHRRRGLIVAPQSRWSAVTAAAAPPRPPKELEFGARTSGHLRRSMRRCAEIDAEAYRSVAGLPDRAGRGATPSDDPYRRKRCQRRPKFRLSGYRRKGPTSDHRSEPASTPAQWIAVNGRQDWTSTPRTRYTASLMIGEPSRNGRVPDDCPESAQPRARTVYVYCADLGEAR